jgi:coproporphyrinogen III oxidase
VRSKAEENPYLADHDPAILSAGLNGGRIESLMVSFPPLVSWKYKVIPENGTPEAAVMAILEEPRAWVNVVY